MKTENYEKLVLGCVLIERDMFEDVSGLVNIDCFNDPIHKIIWKAMSALYDSSKPIDIYTVSKQLSETGEIKKIGGPAYVASLTQSVGSGHNTLRYAAYLREDHIKHFIHCGAMDLISMIGEDADIDDVINKAYKIADLSHEKTLVGTNVQSAGDIASESLKNAEKRNKNFLAGTSPGITSGLSGIDSLTTGWLPGQVVILAGRPGSGKTALMLFFALSAARSGKSVCIYSLEMSSVSLVDRLILAESCVDADHYRTGNLSTEEWNKIECAKATIDLLPIYVDDRAACSMRYAKAQSKSLKRVGKCDLIMFDYLQLADTSDSKKNSNREQEVSAVSRQAKLMAKELNVPVILLSQLSRKVEERADKRPIMADLRESGSIEQDADIVSFVHRPAYYGTTECEVNGMIVSTEGLGIFTIAKQRDGSTGTVYFNHNPSMTQIRDYEIDIMQPDKIEFNPNNFIEPSFSWPQDETNFLS